MIRYASPEFVERLPIIFGDRQVTQAVRGVNVEYGVMRAETPGPGLGRFLNHEDLAQRRRVAFIGAEVWRKLFGSRDPVGLSVRIANVPFEVIGVLDEKVPSGKDPATGLTIHSLYGKVTTTLTIGGNGRV